MKDRHLVSWWFGMLIGLAHALLILSVGMMLLPSIHPRMATERHGPTAIRQLEPPGFMALNYGYQTPISIFLAHAVFGAILGSLYHLHRQVRRQTRRLPFPPIDEDTK